MMYRTTLTYLILIALLTLVVAGGAPPDVQAQQSSRVGLVVRFGDGSLVTRCVAFDGSEISGYEVLRRAGLNVVAAFDSGMGAGICKIEDQGCPKESCLTCEAPNYWSYWHLEGESWIYSQVGASSYTVHDGDVEGWSWGTGDPPGVVPFDRICAPPPTDTPIPTNTPPPTDTPVPPTATLPSPTDTPEPESRSPEAWFRLDQNPIPAGSCTVVRWNTSNAQDIYLDGERVDPDGSREVCPSSPQDYKLRVVGLEGERTYELTLGVTGSASDVSQPTATPSSPLSAAATEPALDASPSPSPSLQPTPISSPTPTASAQSIVTVSPSPTTARVAALLPSPSPSLAVAARSESEPALAPTRATKPRSNAQGSEPDDQGAQVPLSTVGYVVFSLVVGGLLGWLAYIAFQRK